MKLTGYQATVAVVAMFGALVVCGGLLQAIVAVVQGVVR